MARNDLTMLIPVYYVHHLRFVRDIAIVVSSRVASDTFTECANSLLPVAGPGFKPADGFTIDLDIMSMQIISVCQECAVHRCSLVNRENKNHL